MYIFSNVAGVFVFDGDFSLVEKIMFSDAEDSKNKSLFFEGLKKKHKNPEEPKNEALKRILLYFKGKDFFESFYDANIRLTRKDVKDSVGKDILIAQAINSFEELTKTINTLAKRLREWYGLYNPEHSRSVSDHEKFASEVVSKGKGEALDELDVRASDSMGAELESKDIEAIKLLARQINELYGARERILGYISDLMDSLCPNLKAVADVYVGAKLMEHAGSLKRLSEMPSSTVQILGAETALFRHIKTGAKPPKHGVIVNHPLIAGAPENMHGKIARSLADKISLACKVDYFKGDFIGDSLRKKLDEKFGKK